MRTALPRTLLLLLAIGLAVAPETLAPMDAAAAEEPLAPTELARRKAIKGLRTKLRRASRSPYALKKREDILKFIDTLSVLGGHEAGRAAMEAVVVQDVEIRNKAFDVIERTHHAKLVAPLAKILDDKAHRGDDDLHKRIAHALAVMADPKAVEPLTTLIRTDINAEVVEEAARSLASYASLKVDQKREAVKKLINLYATTRNLMMSMRPEDKIQKKLMTQRYKVYGKTVRQTLQSMTNQQLSRPLEWRRWWNDHKKSKKWKPGAR